MEGKTAVKRYCEQVLLNDLAHKMVFISGPRQVGKTTLARGLCRGAYADCEYFNWDVEEDRRTMLGKRWSAKSPLIIFDELHKYARWKQWIKGVYDTKPEGQQYLVTGSKHRSSLLESFESLTKTLHILPKRWTSEKKRGISIRGRFVFFEKSSNNIPTLALGNLVIFDLIIFSLGHTTVIKTYFNIPYPFLKQTRK